MQGMGRNGDRMVGEEGLMVSVGEDEAKGVPRFAYATSEKIKIKVISAD
jgi:hypothetical protein